MKKADQKPEKVFTESNNNEPEIVREKSTHDGLGSEVSTERNLSSADIRSRAAIKSRLRFFHWKARAALKPSSSP
jgi:hypothetical protein